MNIAINAMLAGSDGSIDYLRHILPAMVAQSAEHSWFVYGSNEIIDRIDFAAARVFYRRVGANAGLMSRLIQTHFRLPKMLRDDRIDLIFSPDNLDLFFAPRPRVVALRDADPLLAGKSPVSIRKRLLRFVKRWFARRSIEAADHVVFSSEIARQMVTGASPHCESKSVTLPDGVAAPSGASSQRPDWVPEEYLLVTTEITPQSNLQTVISAYCICREKGLHIPLLLTGGVGVDKYARKLRKQVGKLGLGPHVDFVEHLASCELEPLMAGATAVIHSSVLENSSTTLLSAMRNGAAVIAVDTPQGREAAGDAVLWCDEDDVWTLTHNILRICRNDSYRRILQRRALHHAKEYSWESTAASLVKLFERTSNGKRSHSVSPQNARAAAHGTN
jgi:glycosyltransferase involved in cell wall biosynthesis